VRQRRAALLLVLVTALPRLVALLYERGAIVDDFTEKGDVFAKTLLEHGTYGFIPGQPSAYTQPLYGWFLIPIYWIFNGGWLAIGLAQIVAAVAVAFLVYAIGRRLFGERWGVVAALIATLNPYLVWHDVHVNREIADQLCSAGLVLLTLLVAERPTVFRSLSLGVVTALAMLGNTRLVFVPVLCALYLVWRLPRPRVAAVSASLDLAGAAVAVLPWLVRNKVDVGCWTLTTDGRAFWKANNAQTYGLLRSGHWIDDVTNAPRPPEPGHLTPEEAQFIYERTNGEKVLHPDECLEMRFFQHRALEFMRHHPGEKLKLAAYSTKLLWQPNVFETTGRPGGGTSLDVGRRLIEPAYMWCLYALAAVGLFLAPREFVVLALLLLAYQTACAWAFVGATRYRVAWDFLLALLATAALRYAVARVRRP